MSETQLPENFRLFLDSSVKRLQADLVAPKLSQSELYELYISATAYGDPFQLTASEHQLELAQALSSGDPKQLRTSLLVVFTRCQLKYQNLPSQHASLQKRGSVTPEEIAARAQAFVESVKKTSSEPDYHSRRLTSRQKISAKINRWIALLKSEELKAIASQAQERLIDVIELAAAAATPEQFQKIFTENIPVILAVIEKLPDLKPPLTQGVKNILSATLSDSFTSDKQFVNEIIRKPELHRRILEGFVEIVKAPDLIIRPDLFIENIIAQPQAPINSLVKLTRAEQALTSSPPTLPIELPINIFSIFASSSSANTISKTFAPFLDAFLSFPGVPVSTKEELVKKTLGTALVKEGKKVAATLPPTERERFNAALAQIVSTLGIVAFTPAAGQLVTIKSVVSDTISKTFAPALALPARAITLTLAKILPRQTPPTAPGQPRVYPQIIHSIVSRWQIMLLAAVHVISPAYTTISGGKEMTGGLFRWIINWATHEGIKQAASKTASKSLFSWLAAAALAPATGGLSVLKQLFAGEVIDRLVNRVFGFGKNALFLFSNWFDKVQSGEAPAEGTLVLAAATVIIPIAVLMFITSPLGTWHTEVATFQDELQPFIVDEPGSTYIKVTKTPSPANLPNNPTTPIAYTVTIEANGATLENIQINDVPSLYTKSGSINLPIPTLPTIPTSLTPGPPVSFNYALTPPPNTQDSVLTNSLTISATVNGKPETKTVSSTVIIGSPPTGCFTKGAAGVPDPRGTASVAWSDGDWARLMGAAAMLMRSTFYSGLLCSGGANIPVYRIMNNASGGWVSGGRIFMYNPGMGAGSALYTLAHETGHILAGRQPAIYQDFLGRGLMIKEGYIWTYPFDGVSFTNRSGAGIPSEDFAETIGAYVVYKTYNFKAGLSAESGANRKPLIYPGEYPLHYSYAKEVLFGNIEF